MNFNFVSTNRGIIETADKAILLILLLIDVIVLIKFLKLKKNCLALQKRNPDDRKSATFGIEMKTIIDTFFINFIVIIKIIEFVVIIRMMFIISFYCKVICNAIDNNKSQTGNIYNFVLALISSIFVIIVCKFSIQYIEIIKSKLRAKYFHFNQ